MSTLACPRAARSEGSTASVAGAGHRPDRGRQTGMVAAAAAMLIVGSSVGVTEQLVDYPVMAGQAIRYAAAGLLLVAFGVVTGRLVRPLGGELVRLAILGSVGLAGFNVALVLALRSAEPEPVGVIVGGVPLALALLEPLQTRRRPRLGVLAGAAGAVLGAALVHGAGPAHLAGVGFALAALVAEVAFTLLAVPLLPRLGAVTVAAAGCGVAAAELLAIELLVNRSFVVVPEPTPGQWWGLVYLAVVVTAFALLLWYDAVARIGSAAAGLFAGLVPVGTLATAWLTGGDAPASLELLGTSVVGAAITAGLVASSRGPTVPIIAWEGRTR